MKIEVRSVWRWMMAVGLVGPIIFLLLKADRPEWPQGLLTDTLFYVFLQATLSTVGALLFGGVGAMGLLSLRQPKWQRLVEAVVLLPNLLPTLFVIVAVISLISAMTVFPFGLIGVVLLHVVINGGLVAVALSHLASSRLGGACELAYVEGASPWLFIRRALIFEMRSDLGALALLVFTFCFTSFAVPLIVGGVRATTIEAQIYQHLQRTGGVGSAMGLALFEILILFGLSFVLARRRVVERRPQFNMHLLARPAGLFIPIAVSFALVCGSLFSISKGWQQLLELPELKAQILQLTFGTFTVALATGATVFVMMMSIAYVLPHEGFRRLLIGYTAPSTVLVALAFLWLGGNGTLWVLLKLPVGLSLLYLPALYRWLGDGTLAALRGQIAVARSLGASWGLIWSQIVQPQVGREFGLIAGVAALWASGDFAFSSVVAQQSLTLAQAIQSLLASYRLELASLLLWLMVGVGFIAYFIFVGIGHVVGRKPLS